MKKHANALSMLALILVGCSGGTERPPVYSVSPAADVPAEAAPSNRDVVSSFDTPDAGTPYDVGMPFDAISPQEAGMTTSFRRDIVPIFARSCGNGDSNCHAQDAYTPKFEHGCRGWLSLADQPLGSRSPETGQETGCTDRSLHERLVRFTAWLCDPPRRYVTPGVPAESQIYAMVTGNSAGGGACNRVPGVPLGPMPPPGSRYTVSADSVRLLEAWIRAGALDN